MDSQFDAPESIPDRIGGFHGQIKHLIDYGVAIFRVAMTRVGGFSRLSPAAIRVPALPTKHRGDGG